MTYLERLKSRDAVWICWLPGAIFLTAMAARLLLYMSVLYGVVCICLGMAIMCCGVYRRARRERHPLAPAYALLLALSVLLLLLYSAVLVAGWIT